MNRFAFTTALVLILPVPVSAADCEPILEAFRALAARDTYAQIVTMDGSVMEMRVLPDAMYVNADGQWSSMPGGPEMRKQMLAQLLPDESALTDCKVVGPETVGDVATTAFDYVIPELEAITAGAGTQRLLIRDEDGLPLVLRSPGTEVVISYDGVVAP